MPLRRPVPQKNEHIAGTEQNVPQDVPRDVPQGVPRDVPQEKEQIKEFIKTEIRKNNKTTIQKIADKAGLSRKTVQRMTKEIDNLKYIGRGSNGHWELND